MNADLTLYYFSMFTGLSNEDAEKWQDLCAACFENIRAKLRPNVDLQLNEKRLSMAIATLAAYQYETITNNLQPNSVKIGDVSFSGTSSVNENRKKECLEMISDLINSQAVFIKEVTSV